MVKRLATCVMVLGLMVLFGSSLVQARAAFDVNIRKEKATQKITAAPAYCLTAHRVGRMVLAINNNGTFGTGFAAGSGDCFTGGEVPSCEYPKGSDTRYLFAGAFWIGAVVGRDTLVSTGADGWSRGAEEFRPDESPFGDMIFRSIIDPNAPEYEGAVSEEDFVAVYMDTSLDVSDADFFGRGHRPLNIEVTEASYAWSYEYAEDIVLFDYKVRNIGTSLLKDVYMGFYVDADIHFGEDGGTEGAQDDLSGFLETFERNCFSCTYDDTVFVAWTADNDGKDEENPDESVNHVTATRIVRTPSKGDLEVSYNWWVSNGDPTADFGPRERPGMGEWGEPLRDFRTGGTGTPEGDVNKYYLLRNREFDYDQAFTASIQQNDPLWLPPLQQFKYTWSQGLDTRYLLSFGPFDISPGEVLPISLAYLAGEDLHTDPDNLSNIDNEATYNPQAYYDNLDFSDLAVNSQWASWIYDNPGVDTDDDGDFGILYECRNDSAVVDSVRVWDEGLMDSIWIYSYELTDADTCFIRGDNVPDFKGASPPPAPKIWVEPSVGELKIRFNGLRSETTEDVFSREIDFEGYRVYLARDDRAASYSLAASYDREDYNKWIFSEDQNDFVLLEAPYTLEQIRCAYADSCNDPTFHPLDYGRDNPVRVGDSVFYFAKQDFNASEFGVSTPITKRFPNEPFPSSIIPDSADSSELTEDGYLKYFEYEFEIDGLLPTVPYWVNVTAFDYGSPQSGLPSLETSVTIGSVEAYPLASASQLALDKREVFVYPNPYRIDADYRGSGFEGRTETDRPDDRVRRVHFANVPPKCTISIWSLDGDLVREITHDVDPGDPTSTHAEWDLITRNTQLAVSGLYYWTVEDADGNVQVGKLMLIM